MSDADDNGWQKWWDARVAAMETLYGKRDPVVGHSPIPFDLGSDRGGQADVIYFRNHVKGLLAVTSELIGRDDQLPNDLGNYELAICTRADETWAPNLISRLAHYTLRVKINPEETMDIGPALPQGSSIAAFLFVDYGRFKVMGRDAGVLLCFGITSEELAACREDRREEVENALRAANVFPFTDLQRKSVALPAK